MPITVPCVKCKTRFQVPSKFAGQKVRCKNCGTVIRLPSVEKIQAKKQAIASSASKSAAAATGSKRVVPDTHDNLDVVDIFEEVAEPENQPAAPQAPAEPPVLSCSHCEGLLYYDPNFANQTVACPHCGNHLMMPEL